MQRQLTTILAADIAGFSRLVGADEEGTLAAQRAHRAELIDPLVERHGGRIANTAGDSLLIEFPSAVEAMRFAVSLQAGMRERNAGVQEGRRIEYRVGINIGDVVADGADLLGDGVNVAARLEALSPPGGIIVSRAVRDQVRDRMALTLADLGAVQVKNIARPVRAFQVLSEGQQPLRVEAPARRRSLLPVAALAALMAAAVIGAWWYLHQPDFEPADQASMAFAMPTGPSLAVLPFAYVGTNVEASFLGQGIAADITRALTTFGDLTVISSESTSGYDATTTPIREVAEELGVRHVLRGSVEQDGERLRISAHLVDALSGQQVWADRYEADGADVFAVRDEVAQAIAILIGAQESPIAAATLAGSKRKDTTALGTYELLLLAQDLRHRFNREDNAKSLALLERAVELDPNYARAHGDMAWTLAHSVWNGWSDDPDATMRRAVRSAERAIEIDPWLADGYWVLGSVSICLAEDPARSVELYRKALELNPNHPGIMAEWGGFVLPALDHDRGEEGLALLERAMRLNPRHADWYNAAHVSGRFYARQPAAAIQAFEAVAYPTFLSRVLMAASHGHLGRTDRAATLVDEILELKPGYSLDTFANDPEICPNGVSAENLDYLREGLGKAGLPA